MILAEKHIYKPTHKYYAELDNLCFLSKNLYNATMYDIRQHYFNTGEYKNYNKVNFEFTHNNQLPVLFASKLYYISRNYSFIW